MKYSDDELLNELRKCYSDHGKTSVQLLNDADTDYPTSVTYQNRFGSLNEARKKAGVPVIKQGETTTHAKQDFINSVREIYEDTGNVRATDLTDKNNDYPTNYYTYFDTFDDLIEVSDIDKDDLQRGPTYQYDEDDLIESLIECKERHGETATQIVNKASCCPSPTVYIDRFGSIGAARDIAGIEENNIQGERWRRIVGSMDTVDGYDNDADAHIYVMTVENCGKTVYYTGQSMNINDRLHAHIHGTPHIRLFEETNNGPALLPRSDVQHQGEATVQSVEYLIPMYKKDNETDTTFRRRVLEREREEAYNVALKHDTTRVYGGK